MFAARSALLCGAARVTIGADVRTASRVTRSGLHVVAMGRRSKSKKARKNRSESGAQTVVSTAPAAPAAPVQPQQQPAAGAQSAGDQRGPERLSREDWAEIEAANQRAREAMGDAPAPGPAGTGILDMAFSADSMLMFGVDGCVPEVVNGRVAMLGFVSAFVTELATGRSFTTQLAYNLTHGVSPAIAATITIATLAPCVMANPQETPFVGEGIAKYRPEPRAKAGREYLCDPQAIDCSGLPGRDTPLGRIGFGPIAERWNGRAAMVGLILMFMIEGGLNHGLFR